ncbi:hypothetical protein CPT_Paso_033 [Rhizobium phage Paso]|uniref:Uncharacterized protein n=1 Tax=Rhizobium phage Paso TaxID=2767574 RepID=A0A7L8G6N8_9CAUD|nr:hypothetical protein CPT_Paso_033 [Rhizobium phage Paso]
MYLPRAIWISASFYNRSSSSADRYRTLIGKPRKDRPISAYRDLSDEDKLAVAIDFVARSATMPDVLVHFLHEQGLYEIIVAPKGVSCQTSKQAPCA